MNVSFKIESMLTETKEVERNESSKVLNLIWFLSIYIFIKPRKSSESLQWNFSFSDWLALCTSWIRIIQCSSNIMKLAQLRIRSGQMKTGFVLDENEPLSCQLHSVDSNLKWPWIMIFECWAAAWWKTIFKAGLFRRCFTTSTISGKKGIFIYMESMEKVEIVPNDPEWWCCTEYILSIFFQRWTRIMQMMMISCLIICCWWWCWSEAVNMTCSWFIRKMGESGGVKPGIHCCEIPERMLRILLPPIDLQ